MIVFLQPASNKFEEVFIIALELSRESKTVLPFSTIIEVKPVHSMKASELIDVTEVGITTETKLLQPENAFSPIDFTELEIVTEVKAVQLENV